MGNNGKMVREGCGNEGERDIIKEYFEKQKVQNNNSRLLGLGLFMVIQLRVIQLT
jgi:hypothetical protein